MLTFALRGNTRPQLHASYSCTPLEVKGHFHMSGPQPVSNNGGAPEWVAQVLRDHPDVEAIAVCREHGGVVWQRMKAL